MRRSRSSAGAHYSVTPQKSYPKYYLQLEPDTKPSSRSIPDTNILEEAREKLQELFDKKYIHIISQTATDIARTNLIRAGYPYRRSTNHFKALHCTTEYHEFMDHQIKQLEEVDIISQSMSNSASPILVVPKKEEFMDTSNNPGNSKNGKFNLKLCINYRKLNSQIQTACQVKADGSLGKVITNYPLPTTDSILLHFNGCKFFSTID